MATIADAIFAFDRHGVVHSFNAAAERMFGYVADDIIGFNLAKVIAEPARPGAFNASARHKDGSLFPVRFTVHEIPTSDGSLLVGVARESALRARGYEDLLNEHSLLLATLEATADGILVVDLTGKIVRFNERFKRLWHIPDDVLASRDDDRALAHVVSQLKDPDAFLAKVKELYSSPDVESFDVIEFADGRVFERVSVPQRVDDRAVGRVWSFRDVTELAVEERRARRRLYRLDALWRLVTKSEVSREDLARQVLEEGSRALGFPIGLIAHRDGTTLILDYASFAAPAGPKPYAGHERLAGLIFDANATVMSTDLETDVALAAAAQYRPAGVRAMIGTPVHVGDKQYALIFASHLRLDGPFDDEDRAYVELLGDYIGRILFMAEQDRQISYLAYHDPLTGIANRMQFQLRLGETIAAARRRNRCFGLVYVDLDRFKEVNDTLGHAGGDRILIEAARRLGSAVRHEDLVARLGGDEFAVLVTEIDGPSEAQELARRICGVLATPFRTGHHDFYLSASIGIALFPTDGDSAETLFANADAAMYRAKEEGRDRYRFYSNEIAASLQARQQIREGLRRALAQSELTLFYQPVLNIRSSEVIGSEALMRWQHPERGLLLPGEFIPLVEETNLMVQMGTWGIRHAFKQSRQWNDRGRLLRLAVNLSARQFQDPEFVATLRGALAESGADARSIELEITESVALRDPSAAQTTIRECRDLGFRVVLDDFGTYYSSLSYLKKLGADTIKIDRSFVNGLPSDEGDAAIVRAIIALGRSLGREIIAEGVETPEQANWLIREGCSTAQGFLYARPMPEEDFEHWLGSHPIQAAV
ncbi:MAG: EAL domain-containing protein [Candidatus Eremiobacteraeota bacterium]|nr:EAL domain-containing protein [Candidatus Eremiobacteraeota bacterium]